MINYCQTCKHRLDPKSEKRCMDCSKGNLLNWEPEEQGQEEKSINEEMTLELKMEAELSEEQKAAICGYKYPRKRILTLAVPKYEHERSKYPEQIRVSFADGHTAVYDMRVDQPAPVIMENIRIIRKWKQGYVNQPERRRRRK